MKSERYIQPNMQDLVKFLALASMIVDHLGLFVYFESWMRVVGRFSAPVFLFFAGYNYFRKKHEGVYYCFELGNYRKILLLGIACQVLTIIHIPDYLTLNILISISIGLIITDVIINLRVTDYVAIPALTLTWPLTYEYFDYGSLSAVFVYLGYLANFSRKRRFILLALISLTGMFYFTYKTMYFSYTELSVIFFVFATILLIFTKLDFERRVNFIPLILSRFVLPIYVIHYISLVIYCSILYFW